MDKTILPTSLIMKVISALKSTGQTTLADEVERLSSTPPVEEKTHCEHTDVYNNDSGDHFCGVCHQFIYNKIID